jgi:Methyltransferase domain/C-methyltransferase C-terminal domain
MITVQPLYRAEQLPVFQNRIFHSEQEARNCTRGDVVLGQDPVTGLISNQAFRPELMVYDADYHNEQGLSSVFQSHLQNVTEIIQKHFHGSSLIEVGCGKGDFVESLQALGFEVAGLDPAYEGSNPSIIKQYFSAEAGLQGDGIILRHVLEHIQDPVAFLSKICAANGGKGKVYIEVPCFDWICGRRAWFDIVYEHVNYFRLVDFQSMFGTVHEAGRIFHGQYLYAVADLATLRTPTQQEGGRFQFPAQFLDSVTRYAAKLRTHRDAPAAVWGAASKGVIFALFMARAGASVDMVIDINPAKQGKYLPVTGLKVQSPEAAMNELPPGAEIFVMNGNYLDEVKALTNDRFSYIAIDHEEI